MTLLDGLRQFLQAVSAVTIVVVLGAAFLTLLMPTDEINDALNAKDDHDD